METQRIIKLIKTIIHHTGYPKSFFDKIFAYFEQKNAFSAQTVKEIESDYIIKIPYGGKISSEFRNKLKQFFLNDLKVKIMTVFNSFKVSSHFSLEQSDIG